MYLIFNSRLIKEEELSLSDRNRAFAYGDGLFETLIGTAKEIQFLKDHLERLQEGLSVLQIKTGDLLNYEKIEKELFTLVQTNNIQGKARIRIVAWRKSGGLFSPETNELEYLINAEEHHATFQVKNNVCFYEELRKSFSPLSKFKTLSSLHYVMAGIYRKKMKADDVILLDPYGNISECLSSTIFWIKDTYVFTPSLRTGCIDGVMRKQLLRILKEKNKFVIEGEFSPIDILQADFVFTSNVAGLIPILSIESKKFTESHPLFDFLAKNFSC